MELQQTQTLIAETLVLKAMKQRSIYCKYLDILHLEQITITCITDNKSLYDVSKSLTSTTDRRLRVEIATIKTTLWKKARET